jgi:hypothetical protein
MLPAGLALPPTKALGRIPGSPMRQISLIRAPQLMSAEAALAVPNGGAARWSRVRSVTCTLESSWIGKRCGRQPLSEVLVSSMPRLSRM